MDKSIVYCLYRDHALPSWSLSPSSPPPRAFKRITWKCLFCPDSFLSLFLSLSLSLSSYLPLFHIYFSFLKFLYFLVLSIAQQCGLVRPLLSHRWIGASVALGTSAFIWEVVSHSEDRRMWMRRRAEMQQTKKCSCYRWLYWSALLFYYMYFYLSVYKHL